MYTFRTCFFLKRREAPLNKIFVQEGSLVTSMELFHPYKWKMNEKLGL